MKQAVKTKTPFLLSTVAASLIAVPGATQTPTALAETYDNWVVTCRTVGEGDAAQKNCQMSQELQQAQSRQRVLLFALTAADPETQKATVIAPFGLRLADGLEVRQDDNLLTKGAFRTCLPVGCIVDLDLTPDVIAQMKAGEEVTVAATADSGDPMLTNLSLKGFAAAFDRLQNISK